ncbi:MAG: hypothetical protein Udaeo2_32220 [Candidatus Udaeobacter sp.]|nr:MAG: hypothetical protein Udaeo2_32220 [Candidatus Udaeobacter sp.]
MHGFIIQSCSARPFELGHDFCWWDKLHRTLRRDVPQDELLSGLRRIARNTNSHWEALGNAILWTTPLAIAQRRGPEREPQRAEKLAE